MKMLLPLLLGGALLVAGQGWPTLNGDYTGRRYSPLTQINQSNVTKLREAWRFDAGSAVKSTPLMVNGVIYFTTVNNAYAIDAKTGKQLWHFFREARGNLLANRGVAMYKNWIYFGTPDAYLVCLDARTGQKVWEEPIADHTFGYYMSMPPLVVKDKLIVGISGDAADVNGFLKAVDPATGKVLWTWNSVPKWGDPASKTWPNREAMLHGGGTAWVQGSYDPALNLTYWGTGNPHPVMNGTTREGANLYTCSIVALNVDTGKLVWYFQASPHDTMDRDANQSVALFDGMFQGKQRKMLAQASRNGYFFLLDRATGEHLLTAPYGPENWTLSLNKRGEPIPNSKKEPSAAGTLYQDSGTNWYVPSFDPETGLFYVNANLNVWFLTYFTYDADKVEAEDHEGGRDISLGTTDAALIAIDYQTGKVKWKLDYGNTSGILTTAGKLLFTGNSNYPVAIDPATGKPLWHAEVKGLVNNGPMTYSVDGKQYVVMAVRDTLYAWSLP
jgi:alcohol dehydrogenase (cytochrome c)